MKINSLFPIIHSHFDDNETRKKHYRIVREVLAFYKEIKGMRNSVYDLYIFQDDLCELLGDGLPNFKKELESILAIEEVFDYLFDKSNTPAISDEWEDDEDEEDEDDQDYEPYVSEGSDEETETSTDSGQEIMIIHKQPRMLAVHAMLAINTIMTIGIFYKAFSREFGLIFHA